MARRYEAMADYSELLQRIREAAGDPNGKLMQDELVQHIASMRADSLSLRRIYGQGIAVHGVSSPAPIQAKAIREAQATPPARCPQCKREGFLHTTWCSYGMGSAAVSVPDNELPGMWERADFMGGQDEVRGSASNAGVQPSDKETKGTPK